VIRVGPAGWSYDDWEGTVYPRPKPAGFHGLRYLSRFVDCLEVNSTFYALPRRESAAAWAGHLEDRGDFRLLAKVNRDFTHRERADSREELETQAGLFLKALEPLRRARRLSALLAQFPFSFHHDPRSVRRLGLLHGLFGSYPLVLEVRHASWYTPQALSEIRGIGYSLAHVDLPSAWDHPPAWHDPTGPVGYLRLHGRNRAAWFSKDAGRDDKYDYLYSTEEVRGLADRARRLAGEHDQTYVITNNHFSGKAVANALELMAELRGVPVPAPPELLRTFPRLASSARPEGQQELF
jgi:uncharacterized protein YecE (DUF72 family)